MDAQHLSSATLIARLGLPPEDFPALTFCPTSLEGLESFLADLPRTNIAEVLNLLYRAIPQVAGLKLDPAAKMAMLDLLRPEIFEYSGRLTTKLALNEKNTRQVSLSLALLKNLAMGYKSVAVALVSAGPQQNQPLALSLNAAITVLSKMLIICWQCFFNPPRNLWLELHSLYLLARHRDIESLTPLSSQTIAIPALSPRVPYLKIVLAAAADPARFTPQDLKLLLLFLDHSAHLATIADTDPPGLFTIDPDRDQGPILTTKLNRAKPGYLHLHSQELAQYLRQYRGDVGMVSLPPRLIRQVSRYWSMDVVREDEHVEDGAPVSAIFGLNRLHRLLTKTRNIEEYVGKSQLVSFNRHKHETGQESDAWQDTPDSPERQHGTWLRPSQSNPDEPITFVSQREKLEVEPQPEYSAVRTNLSRRGACIELSSPPDNLTPGELVGIKASDANQWRIGIVRWTRITPRLSRLVGIEFITKNIAPCAVALSRESGLTSAYFPGLMLQNSDKSRELLLPSMPFTEHAQVTILTTKAKGSAMLVQSIESTFHLSIFRLDH